MANTTTPGGMKTGSSQPTFDAAALKREFPGLADSRLHYLDSAATAQMPEVVLSALRRFEVEARANVHEGMHTRARAATDAYHQARGTGRALPACQFGPRGCLHLRHDFVDQPVGAVLRRFFKAGRRDHALRSRAPHQLDTLAKARWAAGRHSAVSADDAGRAADAGWSPSLIARM